MAHVTDLGFTMAELNDAIAEGDVRSQVHPEFPQLRIYNYAEETQFKKKWNKITLQCRGLILNTDTGEVVARPWEKFFNFGQMDNRIESTAPVEVTDKMDGSLGILYQRPDFKFAIATRGSFDSKQARHATHLLNTLYSDYTIDFVGQYWIQKNTFLFEILVPWNRIVCDYGDMDDLVMLGAVDKKWGDYYGPTEAVAQIGWPGPVTEVWKFDQFVDALSFPDRKGKEGVVIRSGRNVVKLKQADYVELHRIVTNLSPKTIWEMMGNGKTIEDICANIPDEFHKYVEDIGNTLLSEASEIMLNVNVAYANVQREVAKRTEGRQPNRKDYALAIKESEYAKYLFLLLDGRSVLPVVWQDIRPRGDVKSLVTDEG